MTGRFYHQHFQKWKTIVTLQWTHFFQVIIVNFRDRSILTFYFIIGIIKEETEIALTSLEKMYWRTCSLTLKYHNLSSCLSGNLFYLSLSLLDGIRWQDINLSFHGRLCHVTPFIIYESHMSPSPLDILSKNSCGSRCCCFEMFSSSLK